LRQRILEIALLGAGCWLAAVVAPAQDVASPTPTPVMTPTPLPTRTPAAIKLPSARSEVERQRRQDAAFMTRARLRSLEEIALGQIAARKASHDSVRALAQQITDDRLKSDEALRLFAESQRIDLPNALDAPRQAEVDRIARLPSNEVERAFVEAIRKIHDEDVSDFEKQTQMGQEVELQAWVYDTLPLLEDQQAEIGRVAAELGIPANPPR